MASLIPTLRTRERRPSAFAEWRLCRTALAARSGVPEQQIRNAIAVFLPGYQTSRIALTASAQGRVTGSRFLSTTTVFGCSAVIAATMSSGSTVGLAVPPPGPPRKTTRSACAVRRSRQVAGFIHLVYGDRGCGTCPLQSDEWRHGIEGRDCGTASSSDHRRCGKLERSDQRDLLAAAGQRQRIADVPQQHGGFLADRPGHGAVKGLVDRRDRSRPVEHTISCRTARNGASFFLALNTLH